MKDCVTMISSCRQLLCSDICLLTGVLLRSQGNVYVKCMTPQVAAAAFNSLNGRFFAGECSLPFMAMFVFCHVHVANGYHCV